MDKAKEIELLQSLKGKDTYFSHLFSPETINAMCENIKNDYPIEFGIDLFQDSDVAKENSTLRARIATRKKLDEQVAKSILEKASAHYDAGLEDIAERLVGRKKCLVIKLKNGMDITEDDREDLLMMIGEE